MVRKNPTISPPEGYFRSEAQARKIAKECQAAIYERTGRLVPLGEVRQMMLDQIYKANMRKIRVVK